MTLLESGFLYKLQTFRGAFFQEEVYDQEESTDAAETNSNNYQSFSSKTSRRRCVYSITRTTVFVKILFSMFLPQKNQNFPAYVV